MIYEFHPLCALFPRMDGVEFDALCSDIAQNGLRQPVVLFDGMILDGGNRYRACLAVGVEAQFVTFEGDDPAAFVLSCNLHRRHLEAGQRAAVVALAQDWQQAHGHGGDRKFQAATLPLEPAKSTVADRAAKSESGERTQRMADKLARANPELAQKVAHGELSLPKAIAQVDPKAAKKRRAPVVEPVAAHEAAQSAAAQSDRSPEVHEVLDTDNGDGQPDFDDLLAMLQELQAENEQLRMEKAQLQEQVAALSAADEVKAKLRLTMELLIDAERERDNHMARAHKEAGMHKWKDKQLRLCGKAVGELDDVRKVAGAVQAMARELAQFRQGAPQQVNTPAAAPIVFAADSPPIAAPPMADAWMDYGMDDDPLNVGIF